MSVGGSAAAGLEAGFGMGLRADEANERRKQREFENARQAAADQQRQEQITRTNARQDKADQYTEDDRALSGVNSEMSDHALYGAGLAAQYGGPAKVPGDVGSAYAAKASEIGSRRAALLRKRYEPVVKQEQQWAADTSSRIATGQLSMDDLTPAETVRLLQATTRRPVTDFLTVPGGKSVVGQAIADTTAGLETQNNGLVLQGANALLAPDMRTGLGHVAKDGSEITGKQIAAFVPAPGRPGAAAQPQGNPIQGMAAALTAATAPQQFSDAAPGETPAAQPQQPAAQPQQPAAPQGLTPGSDPDMVMPVLQVTARHPDGTEVTYHAPVTKGRGVGPDDEVHPGFKMSDAVERMGKLGTLEAWANTPQARAKIEQGLKELGGDANSFLGAYYAMHGDAKALLSPGATDPTSQKIAAIQKLAKDQGITFAEASSQLAGHEGPAKRAMTTGGAAPATAGPTGTGLAQVTPAEQATRDAEAVKVIQRERDAAAARLAAGDKSAQADIDAFDKEIAKLKTPAAAPAGAVSVALTKGIKGLTPQQNDALFGKNGAVTQGRVDMNRINSRTAPIYADAELTNPGQDFAKMSGDIQLGRNATFRQRAMTAEVLPEIMQNMVDSGKKLDFSDVQALGKMQAWVKGQLNDPDWTEYMTQRNDALMTIAGVMRSVGMTDKAHQAEIEVSAPSLAPRALDAWMRGQMKSLGPRLRINRGIVKNAPGEAAGATTASRAAPTDVQTATNPKTGEKLMLQGGQWVPFK